jgi:hypothetical protein
VGGNPWREAEIAFTRYPTTLPQIQFETETHRELIGPVSFDDDGNNFWVEIDPEAIVMEKERLSHTKEERDYRWGKYAWRHEHRDVRRQERKFKTLIRVRMCA